MLISYGCGYGYGYVILSKYGGRPTDRLTDRPTELMAFSGRMNEKLKKWQVAAVHWTSGKMCHEKIEKCMQKNYASHHWEALLVPAAGMTPRTRIPTAGCMPARASAKLR